MTSRYNETAWWDAAPAPQKACVPAGPSGGRTR